MAVRLWLLGFVWIVASSSPMFASERELDGRLHHLRSGEQREWSDFPEQAEDRRLVVEFDARVNDAEQTLRLRHVDVKYGWRILLNGEQIGRLPSDENDMVALWPIPPNGLREGNNTLLIEPTDDRGDDVRIGEIFLDSRTIHETVNQAKLDVTVVDAANKPLPCRITVVDQNGSLIPLGTMSDDRLAVRTGMIYTGDGRAEFGIAPGKYTIHATRGMEYSLATKEIEIVAGESQTHRLNIRREVNTTGWVSCDTHVHTFEFSRHGDASLAERMLTIAGEGLELPIATDHNLHVDYEQAARQQNMRRYFTPVIGNEVTTSVGHFNVFPVERGAPPPDHRPKDWATIFDNIHATPGVEVVILNHGRDLHGGFRPFGSDHHISIVGENLDGWTLRANAMELVNSAALQTDPLQLYHDWFGLLNRGLKVTPIGSSDSHEVSRKLVGQGRTYIKCEDIDPSQIDVAAAVRALREGRVAVSMGLFTEITVNERHGVGDLVSAADDLKVTVRVQGPSWITADRVMLFANGVLIKDERLAPRDDNAVEKWHGSWTIPQSPHDVHLVAVAMGPGVTGPYWRIAKSYQPTSPVWTPYVIGSTGVVWIDADRDGNWTSPRQYAEQVLKAADGDLRDLIDRLKPCDEFVAAHVFNLLATRGRTPLDAEVRRALDNAAPATHAGFRQFFDQWKASQAARATLE